MTIETHAAVVVEFNPFRTQPFFHHVGTFEVPLPRKRAETVHHSVRRQTRRRRFIERPANGPGPRAATEVGGNESVRGHAADGDLFYDVPYTGEVVVRVDAIIVRFFGGVSRREHALLCV